MNAAATRRTLLRGLLAGLVGRLSVRQSAAATLAPTGVGPRALLHGFRSDRAFERRYRADAAVIFCGVTIFSRRDVGGAYASVELARTTKPGAAGQSESLPSSGGRAGPVRASLETGQAAGVSATALRFAAGSDPMRCASLNRFGVLEEAVIESDSNPEFAFAGLITDSKEADLEEAKKALSSSAHQQVTFARGSASRGSARSWTELIPLSRPCDWKKSPELLAALAGEEPRSPACEISAGAEPFLSTMRTAALSQDSPVKRPFIHAGKLFALELKRRDSDSCEGTIHSESGAKLASFRVDYAPGDRTGLPTRIEYHAKPYLKLVFESDDRAARPNMRSLFSTEVI